MEGGASVPTTADGPEVASFGPLSRRVDLGHELNSDTVFWPGGEGLNLCRHREGESGGTHNSFYASGSFSCAEHGGTHVDAPYHFYEHGATVERLELEQLIGVARVVCTHRSDVTPDVILQHEAEHGALPAGCILLCNTGWATFYAQGAKAYLGFDERTDGKYDSATSTLAFPGVTQAAAELLVQRRVAAVGLDTASLDPGWCTAFSAHRTLLSAGIYGIENLTRLGMVPPRGATVVVMPLKLTGGSGAPCRVIAFVPP